MNDEDKTSKKWVTRSIVQPKTVLKMNYAPDIEHDIKQYTQGKFETRSIVRPPIHLKMHRVQPYLKMTLGLNDDAKLTYEQAMQIGAKLIAAVIAAAPQLRLDYSPEHSKVEDGKLIAALIPQDPSDDVEELLHELVEKLRGMVFPIEPRSPAQPAFAIDYVVKV